METKRIPFIFQVNRGGEGMTEDKPRTLEDWEEVLPRGEHELVPLSTMIPRKISNDILKAKGILQTTSSKLVYTKKITVEILLEKGLEAVFSEYASQDHDTDKVIKMSARNSLADRVARGETV